MIKFFIKILTGNLVEYVHMQDTLNATFIFHFIKTAIIFSM